MRVEEEEERSHHAEQDHSPSDSHRLWCSVTADRPAPCSWSWRGGQNNCMAGLGSGSLLDGGCEQVVGGHRCQYDNHGDDKPHWEHCSPPREKGLGHAWSHWCGDMWLGLGRERERAMRPFACEGADTFLSIPFWGGGGGCEGV